MDRDCIVELKNVGFTYEEGAEVLKSINLSFYKGEFVCVLGHNGSGKSTLAKLMNALLVPTEGEVLVKGLDTRIEENETQVRRAVGTVFQNPDNQIVATIVEDDVAFGPENLGVPPEEIRRRVDEALKTVGMYDYRLHEPHRLSGGQKQRIAIAGAIAMRTDCIVLDEPTAMLDPKGRREVMNAVRSLNRELGITVILITHFMDEAVSADRVIVINDGSVFCDGTPIEVFSHPEELKAMGLDVPGALMLARILRDNGVALSGDILTPEEFTQKFIDFTEGKNGNS